MRQTCVQGTGCATNFAPPLTYEFPVHFYSTAMVAQKLNLDASRKEWQLLSLCTHLPDETNELSAVKVRLSLGLIDHFAWGWFDRVGSESTRQMITIQQLLHGLTGGSSASMNSAAKSIVSILWKDVQVAVEADSGSPAAHERPERICALGFGLHLLGDSFAHRMLNASDRDRMYRTGRGHFADGTLPDTLLRNLADPPDFGVSYWREYIETLAKLKNPGAALDADLASIYQKLVAIRSDETSNPHKAARRLILRRDRWGEIHEDWAPEDHKSEACQDYLDAL